LLLLFEIPIHSPFPAQQDIEIRLRNYLFVVGVRRAAVLVALCYEPEGRGFDSFWPHYYTGFDSAFNRNEYQEYFLGVKAAGVTF
jgi:hypothetical protein